LVKSKDLTEGDNPEMAPMPSLSWLNPKDLTEGDNPEMAPMPSLSWY
jgi:hypothetical protein